MLRVFALVLATCLGFSAHAQSAIQTSVADLRFLDRTTGDLADVNITVGQSIDLGALSVVLNDCRYRARAINRDAFAHLEITDSNSNTLVFDGWMMASSPALNALEHPRYDVWVLRCKRS